MKSWGYKGDSVWLLLPLFPQQNIYCYQWLLENRKLYSDLFIQKNVSIVCSENLHVVAYKVKLDTIVRERER